MMGFQMIDVAIGLIFIYLVLALACTAILETFAGLFDRRRANLELGIKNLLGDKDTLWQNFYNHPLIKALKEDSTPPSYIPAQTFSATLVDMLVPATAPPDPANAGASKIERIRSAISALSNVDLKTSLLIMLDDAKDDEAKFKAALETWFNNSMDRISAWYKQKTHRFIVVVAILLTVSINADTVDIAEQLYTNPSVRQALVAQAQEYAKKGSPPPAQAAQPAGTPAAQDKSIGNAGTLPSGDLVSIQKLQDQGLKLGWKNASPSSSMSTGQKEQSCAAAVISKIVGLLITALAASLGAPFWFDTLSKIVSIRGVGKSPEEKKS